MSWFKVDDHMHSHRKTMRAGTEAMGLWVLAGSWSSAEESDGWVPGYVLPRLAGPAGEALAHTLVAAGLWDAETVDGEEGYRFRGWEEYQPTKAQLEAKRAEGRERMRRARGVRANTAGTARDVRSTRPDPSRPNKKNTTAADAADFESWWQGYPRKTGKLAAAKAYEKARQSTDADTLTAGLANAVAVWQASRTEPQFIPHAATWLNQGRWTDEQPVLVTADPTPARNRTLAQCAETDEHDAHRWGDARNDYHCQGITA